MISAVALKVAPDLEVVVPQGKRFNWRVVEDLEVAYERQESGDLTGARAVLAALERRLSVEEAHRIAARSDMPAGPFLMVGPGARIAASIRASRHIRSVQERQRAIALTPNDIPSLSDKDRYDLGVVEQKLDEARKHKEAGNRRMAKFRIQDAQRILLNIERSRLDRLNTRWCDRILGEIEALELAIGGSVERKSQFGGTPLQLSSRDGLYTLRNSLTKTQGAAAMAYRELYEKTDPERALKPKSIDPSDQPLGRGGDGWAEKRAKLWDQRSAIDARVRAAAGSRGLRVLHEVAGKGRTVSSLTSGGRRRAQDVKRLLLALDEAAFAMGF